MTSILINVSHEGRQFYAVSKHLDVIVTSCVMHSDPNGIPVFRKPSVLLYAREILRG